MDENNIENNRAFPVEINPEKTPLPHITGITITARAADVLPGLL